MKTLAKAGKFAAAEFARARDAFFARKQARKICSNHSHLCAMFIEQASQRVSAH